MSERWDDERLLEYVLDPTDSDRAQVEADPDLRERAEALAGFLGQVRTTLHDDAPAAETFSARRVTERVLEGTTREDLSWRGDLLVFSRFVTRRMRQSGLLRLAAASLLLHVVGAPVVIAYVLLHEPEPDRQLTIRMAEPVEEFPEAPPEPFDPDHVFDSLHPTAAGPDALSRDRRLLGWGLPLAEGKATTEVTRRLRARAREASGQPTKALPTPVDPLDCIVAAEWELDRYARGWSTSGEVLRALAALPPSSDDQLGLLALAAMARAEGYGLLDAEDHERLEAARATAADDATVDLLRASRAGGPASAAWRSRLGEALARLGIDDPISRAWR